MSLPFNLDDLRIAILKELAVMNRRYSQNLVSGDSISEVLDARAGALTLNDRIRRDLNNISIYQINKNAGKIDETYLSDELKAQIAGTAGVSPTIPDNSLTTNKFTNKAITPEKTSFLSKGKNLFNGQYLRNAVVLGDTANGGRIETRSGGTVAIINVGKGGTFTVWKSADTDRFGIGTSVGSPAMNTNFSRYLSTSLSGTEYTLTLQGEEDHVIVYLSTSSEDKVPERFQIERGSSKTSFESPEAVNIKLSSLALQNIGGGGSGGSAAEFGFFFATNFGASVDSIDNTDAINAAINYAGDLYDEHGTKTTVFLTNGNFRVNSTVYHRSGVLLDGPGQIIGNDNAAYDTVTFEDENELDNYNLIPGSAKVLLAMVGTIASPIKHAGIKGVQVDYNGANQTVASGSSHIGIAMVHTEDCYIEDAASRNVVYEHLTPGDGKRAMCLYVAYSKRPKFIRGIYERSGYDAIRIGAYTEDVFMDHVFGGQAVRGSIQVTPRAGSITGTGCIFDNREGGFFTSHAFFAHNPQNVTMTAPILRSLDGYGISIFSDGIHGWSGFAKNVKITGAVIENKERRFVELDKQWTSNIEIDFVDGTKDVSEDTSTTPIFLRETKNCKVTMNSENADKDMVILRDVDGLELGLVVKTDKTFSNIVNVIETNGRGAKNVTIYKTIIDAPNVTRLMDGKGLSKKVKIKETRLNTKEAVRFAAGDENIQLLDSDFEDVQALNKLTGFSPTSGKVKNVIGTEDQ